MTHIHLVGIGGTGLSSIARVLLEMGYSVSGSDRMESAVLADLRAAGAVVYVGHAASQVAGADLVIRSSAIDMENPEIQEANARGIRVLKRSEFFNAFLRDRKMIAVAGTHGKTTTTAMIAWILECLGEQPGFIIGGSARNLGTSARAGQGEWFVIEADEYDYMFQGLHPMVSVVTMMEHDHPDCFPTQEVYADAFRGFVRNTLPGGAIIACQDDPGAASLMAAAPEGVKTVPYGYHKSACYRPESVNLSEAGTTFTLVRETTHESTPLAEVALLLTGEHNVRNALAGLAVVDQLGLPVQPAADALGQFQGTGRRFEIIGEANGMVFIDDYAHHPTEIQATLAAARQRYPRRQIWAVWQPHTYSRTQSLEERFAQSFKDADHVLVTGIYAAREANPGYSAETVVRRMAHPDARYVAELDTAIATLTAEMRPDDVLLVMSAGDATRITREVFAAIKNSEANHG